MVSPTGRQVPGFLIHAALRSAIDMPFLFRPRPNLGNGIDVVRVESHVAYVRRSEGAILVLTILHRSMKAERHLRNVDNDID
jgi:plasmid stabilization system protein ParE